MNLQCWCQRLGKGGQVCQRTRCPKCFCIWDDVAVGDGQVDHQSPCTLGCVLGVAFAILGMPWGASLLSLLDATAAKLFIVMLWCVTVCGEHWVALLLPMSAVVGLESTVIQLDPPLEMTAPVGRPPLEVLHQVRAAVGSGVA